MSMISSHLRHVACGGGRIQIPIGLVRARKAASAAFSEPVTRAVHRDDRYQHQRAADGAHDDDRDLFLRKRAVVVVVGVYVDWPWRRPGAERRASSIGVLAVEPDIHEIGVGGCRVCDR